MKVYNVIWTFKAIFSLQNLHNFIKAESLEKAIKVTTGLVSLGNSLSTLPHRFPLEPNLIDEPEGFRFAVKWYFKLIYTIENEQVIIVEVFDTRRDPSQMGV